MAKVELGDIYKIFSHNLLQRELINRYRNVDRRGIIKIKKKSYMHTSESLSSMVLQHRCDIKFEKK